MAETVDLVIRGGRVFDSETATFAVRDVVVAGGKVLDLPEEYRGAAPEEMDATGLIVAPGLIDAHVHAFPWGHLISLDVDPVSSRSGVTTFIDGGSTGSLNFLAFRRYVVDRVRSNLFALLNVSAIGQATDGIRGLEVGEYDDLRFLHLASAIEVVERNRDVIVGIKVRMYNGLTTLAPLAAGRELADEVGLPLVVHVAPPPPAFAEVLPYLRPGDVITHVYHPPPGAMVDGSGRLKDVYREARARGVLFDTGTARYHTDFVVARAAIEQGLGPDIISTDLTANNAVHLTIDLPTTMSKYLALGLSLPEVLAKVTAAPARLLPRPDLGRLTPGRPADLAVLEVEEGSFTYEDYFGHSLSASQRISVRATLKDGRLLDPIPASPIEWGFIKR